MSILFLMKNLYDYDYVASLSIETCYECAEEINMLGKLSYSDFMRVISVGKSYKTANL